MQHKIWGISVSCAILALVLGGVVRADPLDLIPIQTIILEAGNQGINGMVAVGEVIRTRARERGLSFERICLQPKQFSCWNDRESASRRLHRESREIGELAAMAWELSATSNLTHHADHYHADYIKPPYWAKSMCKTTKVGTHIFYKSCPAGVWEQVK